MVTYSGCNLVYGFAIIGLVSAIAKVAKYIRGDERVKSLTDIFTFQNDAR